MLLLLLLAAPAPLSPLPYRNNALERKGLDLAALAAAMAAAAGLVLPPPLAAAAAAARRKVEAAAVAAAMGEKEKGPGDDRFGEIDGVRWW